MQLSAEELLFLARQGLGLADVYDTRGISSARWKREIREAGKTLALGTPCSSAGHRLRTRSGHCAQCDPAKIAYQNRYHRRGFVYIAGSLAHRVIKIGTAVNCAQREANLRGQRYGGIADWLILFHVEVDDAGKVEQEALRLLRHARRMHRFEKDGRGIDAGEILGCSFKTAFNAIRRARTTAALSQPWMSLDNPKYNFQDK